MVVRQLEVAKQVIVRQLEVVGQVIVRPLKVTEQAIVVLQLEVAVLLIGMVIARRVAMNVLVIVPQLQVGDRWDMVSRGERDQLVRLIILMYEWMVG